MIDENILVNRISNGSNQFATHDHNVHLSSVE